MTFALSKRSMDKMKGVHPDLQRVIKEAITASPYDFAVTEGVRSTERQRELVAAGKSRTMKSRHVVGKAVDIVVYVDGQITWNIKYYKAVTDHIKAVGVLCDVALVFGIDWESFIDAVHIELDKEVYK